jgi:hypothetical protein
VRDLQLERDLLRGLPSSQEGEDLTLSRREPRYWSALAADCNPWRRRDRGDIPFLIQHRAHLFHALPSVQLSDDPSSLLPLGNTGKPRRAMVIY